MSIRWLGARVLSTGLSSVLFRTMTLLEFALLERHPEQAGLTPSESPSAGKCGSPGVRYSCGGLRRTVLRHPIVEGSERPILSRPAHRTSFPSSRTEAGLSRAGAGDRPPVDSPTAADDYPVASAEVLAREHSRDTDPASK